MELGKKLVIVLLCLIFTGHMAYANKSVFIISKHKKPSLSQAYTIDGNHLHKTGNYNIIVST